MRKIVLFVLGLVLLNQFLISQEVVVAGWTFPGNSAVADTGEMINLGNEIYTIGGTSEIQFKNGFETKAAQTTGWDNGLDLKAWVVSLSTEGYADLTVSSMQTSGGQEPGPKYYKIQHSIDDGNSWDDVINGDVEVENDWETGIVDGIPLPEDCNNIEDLMIRWIMTSNEASGDGGDVLQSGKSKIDEIYIKGEASNGIPEKVLFDIAVGPNPVTEKLIIRSDKLISCAEIRNISGKLIFKDQIGFNSKSIEVVSLAKGFYILTLKFEGNYNIYTEKLIVN